MRIFVGLDLPEDIRQKIRSFMDEVRGYAPDVRWVAAESLHITLKFIGEKPDATVKEVENALRSISTASFRVSFRGSGFFPSPRAARVFWVGIEAEPGLAQLAQKVESAVEELGIPRENRDFSPHLTLARAGSGSPARQRGDRPNQRFARLAQHLGEISPPEFGTMRADEIILYRSQLSSHGSKYTKIAAFPLKAEEH
jgi:RNA 2',3'-cyclic 3'-phosphodiesterase